MADGAIRIETIFEVKAAKKNIENLCAELEKAKKTYSDYKNEAEDYSKEGYKERLDATKKELDESLKTAKNIHERKRITEQYQLEIEQINAEQREFNKAFEDSQTEVYYLTNALKQAEKIYNSLLEKKKEMEASDTSQNSQQKEQQKAQSNYEKLIERRNKLIAMGTPHSSNQWKSLTYDLRQAKKECKDLGVNVKDVGSSSNKAATRFAKLKNFLSSATNAAKGMAKAIGGAALNGVKKLGSSIKSKLVNGFKSGASQAESIRKKLMKMSLALIGMRGIWGGIRQLVSSALSNNEQLQNQLTAVKGVLGQALAPAIQIITNALGQIVTFVDKLYTMLTGTSLVAKYNASQAKKIADSTKKAADSAEKYKNQMASFDVANKLEDNSSFSSTAGSGSSESDYPIFEEKKLSGWAQNLINKIKSSWESADFTDVGKMVAGKIAGSLNGINWDDYRQKASKAGKSFATFINGLVSYSDEDGKTLATSIGNALAQAVNTAIDFLYSFVSTLKWGKVGSELSKGFSAFIKNIEWEKAIKTAYKAGAGTAELLRHLFVDKDEDGDTALSNATKAIANIINAITAFVKGAIDELNKVNEKTGKTGWTELGESISKALIEGLLAVNWKDIVSNIKGIVTGITDLIKAMFATLDEIDPDSGMTYGQKLWNELGKHIVAGILAGMVAALALPFMKGSGSSSTFGQVFQGVYDGLCDAFEINSPAKKMYPIGGYIFEGILEGIKEKLSNIKKWFEDNVFSKISEAWDSFKGLTLSIGATISKGFDAAVNLWNSVKAGTKTALANITHKLSDKFKDAAGLWSNFKAGTKSAIANLKANLDKKWKDHTKEFKSIYGKKAKNTVAVLKAKSTKAFKDAKKNWDSVKTTTSILTATLKDNFTTVFKHIVNTIISGINTIIGWANKILPGKLKITKVPQLARGGIVNNPGAGVPAIVGEAGPEAILPLNDEVFGKIASMINGPSRGTGQIVIPVYLDSRQIARYTIDTMNKRAFENNTGGAY